MTPARPVSPSRYRVERILGRGGMATVYLAHDTVLGRRVALKVLAEHLADDETFRARFLREARLAARIVHPNVVQLFDAGDDGQRLSIVMELVEGETLAAVLGRRGRLSPSEVVDVGTQLCAGLGAAHAAGLVHRDVKPQNILCSREGVVKLGDFGIARSDDSTALTEHGSVLGTASYLAPEQARGEMVTPATDLYALGVVLYEALTGARPHEATTLAELLDRREQEPPTRPTDLVAGVPAPLERAILRCLAPAPERRPVSARALAGELAAAPTARGRPAVPDVAAVAAEGGTAPTRVATTRRLVSGPAGTRLRRPLAVALALLALAGLGLAVLTTRGSGGGSAGAVAAKPPARTTAASPTPASLTPPPAGAGSSTQPLPCAGRDERADRFEDAGKRPKACGKPGGHGRGHGWTKEKGHGRGHGHGHGRGHDR